MKKYIHHHTDTDISFTVTLLEHALVLQGRRVCSRSSALLLSSWNFSFDIKIASKNRLSSPSAPHSLQGPMFLCSFSLLNHSDTQNTWIQWNFLNFRNLRGTFYYLKKSLLTALDMWA